MNLPIIEVDHGVASIINDDRKKWIEVNRNLKKYPELYKLVMANDVQELQGKNKDISFWQKVKGFFYYPHTLDALKFCVTHPKTVYIISPFFYNKKWGVHWRNLIFWSIVLVIFGIFIWLV